MSEQDEIVNRLLRLGPPQRDWRPMPWLGLVALLTVGVWMLYLTWFPLETLSVWDLQDPHRVVPWLGGVGLRYALHACMFLALGMLLPGLFHGPVQRVAADTASPSFLKRIVALVGYGLLIYGVLSATLILALWLISLLDWNLQLGLEVAIGVGCLILGVWSGFWWRRTRCGWLKQMVIAIVGLAVFGVWLQGQLLQPRPLPFDVEPVTLEHKRALLELVRTESVAQEGQRVYRISLADLNKLLAWWISVESVDGKARVQLEPKSRKQQLQASIRLPVRSTSKTYVNLQLYGQCEIIAEELLLEFDAIQLGAFRVPQAVDHWLGNLAVRWISSDRRNLDLLTGIRSAATDGDQVQVAISNDGVRRRRLAKVLRHLGDNPDVTDEVRTHLRAFAEIVRRAEPDALLFDTIVRDAFDRAHRNSSHSHVVEANSAAIQSLGIALGHVQLERAIGDCWADERDRLVIYHLPLRCQLRGRSDWGRHFWVSAALSLVAGNRAADAAGLLKEELDADEGGSGFSFADLMADRAGTEFARTATSDERAARAIQRWVLDEHTDLNQLMPSADQLPEGLSQQQLHDQFDGVGGPRYQKQVAEMEQQLRDAAWRGRVVVDY